MLLGDLELAQGGTEAAIEAWKRIETPEPGLPRAGGGATARRLPQSRQAGEKACNLLRGYLEQYPSLDALNVVFQANSSSRAPSPPTGWCATSCARNPTLLGLDKLLEAQLLEAPVERRRDLRADQEPGAPAHAQPRHVQVRQLRLPARQFYWHCPACNGWETYSPRRTEEREMACTSLRRNRTGPRVMVALDFADAASARSRSRPALQPQACRLKVGKELFTAAGPALVEDLVQQRLRCLPRSEIPRHPQHRRRRPARRRRGWASGCSTCMRWAAARCWRRRAKRSSPATGAPHLIAVTVLTSMAEADLREIGIEASALDQALRLARLAQAKAGSTA